MASKKLSGSRAYAGAAGFVIAAAAFGALFTAAKFQASRSVGENISAPVGGSAEAGMARAPAWEIPQVTAPDDPHLVSQQTRQFLAWSALAGLAGSVFAMFGANRLLNLIVGLGQVLGRWGARAAEAPVKAARSAARATVKVMKKPGRWLATVIGLGIFALTGVAFLDVTWEAGLIAGAGMGAAAAWGWQKTGTMLSRRWDAVRRRPASAATD